MKTLELKQMEIINAGGACDGQMAAFATANVAMVYAVFGGPIGMAIATVAFTIALVNLNNCIDEQKALRATGKGGNA